MALHARSENRTYPHSKFLGLYRVSGVPGRRLTWGNHHQSRIPRLADAETVSLFPFGIPFRGQPHIACKNQRIDGAALWVILIGQGTDVLLILEDGDAGEGLWFGAHAESCNQNPGSGSAHSLAGSPFDKGVGKNERAVSAEKEVDDKIAELWMIDKFSGPIMTPVLTTH